MKIYSFVFADIKQKPRVCISINHYADFYFTFMLSKTKQMHRKKFLQLGGDGSIRFLLYSIFPVIWLW